ncbi:hypothetical protein [Sulfurimonas sp.]|uniref:hypothetical protein n=1 Tax=Sulfurimonas sp. TaxID=2022749 RepID=UPI003564325D
MKERVYQSLVGVLVVAVSVTSYQLYNQDGQTNSVAKVAQGIDIASAKPKYEHISSKELLMQQQRRNKLEKVKLDTSLVELRNSRQKSMAMIKEYNKKYPNNPISQDFEINAMQDSVYDFNTAQVQPSYEQIQQQVESTNRKIEVAQSSSSTKSSDSSNVASNSYGGSYGGGSTSASVALSSSQPATQNIAPVETDTQAPASEQKELDKELLSYQASIVNITKVIEQINSNLN